ncbi:MAG TPA: DMT family transporter [Candidatus Dormibacteraeota bacterium]|nr:DMT family transporter [Candidatus Dormibacteraeota bacterium]
MQDRSLLVGSATVVVAAAGFGLLGPVARFAYDAGLQPLSFVAWRGLFGTLVVALFVAWRVRRGRPLIAPWRLPAGQGRALLVATITALLLNVAMFIAFERTTVALVLLGFYTYPALVAVTAVWRGVERLDGVRAASLVLALGGMVLVVAGGLNPAGELRVDALGIGLALGAAVSQTVFVTISRNGFPGIPTDQAMGWILAATTAVCATLAIVTGGGSSLAEPVRSGQALWLSALAGIAAAGIPSILFLRGIRTIGGTRTGILMLFEPVVGVGLAAILLHEGLAPIQVVGGGCILAAAVLLQRSEGPVVAAPAGAPTAAVLDPERG